MMKKPVGLLVVFAVLILAIMSCQERPNILEPQSSMPTKPPQLALPGVTLDSAIFSIYVDSPSGQTVNVHRITAAWGEMTVTWNSFAGAYDPAVVGTFVADGIGWRSANVTSLVQQWIDGVYPDYGLLLEQGQTGGGWYFSSEYATVGLHPMLKICYTTSGGSQCVTIQRGTLGTVADAYIWQIFPDDNHGSSDLLYTGLIGGYEKQSLLQFSMPEFPQTAAIGDFVWYDLNQNGIQDAGELGIPGVTVELYTCADVLVGTTTTDANGLYLFSGLAPGDYYVKFTLLPWYAFSPQDQGSDDAVDSDANPTTGIAACTNLSPGETDLTWDAGMYEVPLPPGCTKTIGYWKTHAGFGPQPDMVTPLLPIWLGTPAGPKSLHVTTAAMAVDILSQNVYGDPSNGITKLYAQLLGAKLNIASGADGSAVAATIANADVFLATHNWLDWISLNKATKKMVLSWQTRLDNYNNGLIGPIHCY